MTASIKRNPRSKKFQPYHKIRRPNPQHSNVTVTEPELDDTHQEPRPQVASCTPPSQNREGHSGEADPSPSGWNLLHNCPTGSYEKGNLSKTNAFQERSTHSTFNTRSMLNSTNSTHSTNITPDPLDSHRVDEALDRATFGIPETASIDRVPGSRRFRPNSTVRQIHPQPSTNTETRPESADAHQEPLHQDASLIPPSKPTG